MMIKTAVILAAGRGSRLAQRTKNHPKGFLELDQIPIIEHSIKKLVEVGIERIVIGTGYLSEWYIQLSLKYPQITCVANTEYAMTGSMYTLYQMKNVVQEDFVLLESDLIYEKQILNSVLTHPESDCIAASGFTNSGDEVFIGVNDKGHLVNMSKKPKLLNSIFGELVGITKLSHLTFQMMCKYAEDVFSINKMLDYEEALVGISGITPLTVHKLTDFVWCEIDNETQWNRAIEIIYPMMKSREGVPFPVKKNILLNPGPSTTTDTVKFAQIVPDVCPRENEFGDIMGYISIELTKFVAPGNDYTTIMFGGSGTAAVEAILSSAIDHEAVLIINNGAYGKRMCQIAEAYQLPFLEFKSPVDKELDLKKIEKFILKSPQRISHLAVVHNETTTGLLNPVEEIGEICKKYHISLIVDAMSSFAAIPIDMKKMNISFLAASSNKGLQGMAGVSFVIAKKDELEGTKQIKPRNLYLHLYSQYFHFEQTNQMRFTPPVQTLYALKQAIIETKMEGIENRYKRYTQSWDTLMKGIERLGLKSIIKRENHSKLITAIIEPNLKNYSFQQMHDFFYKKGFTIYPGKFDGLDTFRVANIGEINSKDIEKFIRLLEQYLDEIK